MSTTNSNENLLPGSNFGSDSDSADMVLFNNDPGVREPVFMHLSRTLTIRELVHLKNISKKISNLVSTNSAITARIRAEDNTIDWYYPLYLNTQNDRDERYGLNSYIRVVPLGMCTGSWFRVHRPSGEFHNLPSYCHFLRSIPSTFHSLHIHASVEGLLLMLLTHRDPIMSWKPLVVTNPVTREWKLLPALHCRTLGLTSWNYGTFQLRMTGDKMANAYKVILLHRKWLCVYKSTNNTWSSHIMTEQFPFGTRNHMITEHYDISSTVLDGRIHFAQLEYDDDPQPKSEVEDDMNLLERGQLRVYEVDDEVGTWNPGVQYKLQSYIPSNLYRNYKDYGFRIGSYKVDIVECMGCMYAIIVAWLNNIQKVDEDFRKFHELAPTHLRYVEYGFLPLRFYILQLTGSVGRPFGQLLIQDPDGGYNKYYKEYFLDLHLHAKVYSFYRCFARGNVIWVTLLTNSTLHFTLQYDVVSGKSTTVLPHSKAFYASPTKQNVAFAPSLYMKP